MNDLVKIAFYYGAGRIFIPLPRFFIFNPTRRCDLACQHCGVWKSEKKIELSSDELRELLKNKLFQKIEVVWLSGGEPSLRKDLAELTEVFNQSLPKMQILGMASNGYNSERIILRCREMLQKLNPAKQGFFLHLSLDGIGEPHNKIRGKEDAFENLIKTIDRFKKLKEEFPRHRLELGFNCVIQKGNYFQLKEIFEFAQSQSASITFNLVEITDQYYSNIELAQSLSLSPDEKQAVIEFLKEIINKLPAGYKSHYKSLISILSGKRRTRRCLSLYSTVVIDSDGSWIPCPLSSNWQKVNFLQVSAEKFWKSKTTRELRKRIQKQLCPKCGLSCSLGDSLSISEFLRGGFE